jgi:predicted metalloenzyme YecM
MIVNQPMSLERIRDTGSLIPLFFNASTIPDLSENLSSFITRNNLDSIVLRINPRTIPEMNIKMKLRRFGRKCKTLSENLSKGSIITLCKKLFMRTPFP